MKPTDDEFKKMAEDFKAGFKDYQDFLKTLHEDPVVAMSIAATSISWPSLVKIGGFKEDFVPDAKYWNEDGSRRPEYVFPIYKLTIDPPKVITSEDG